MKGRQEIGAWKTASETYWNNFLNPVAKAGVGGVGYFSNWTSGKVAPILSKMKTEYLTLGALTPETRAQFNAIASNPASLVDKDENERAEKIQSLQIFFNRSSGALNKLASWDPRTADPNAPVNILAPSGKPVDFMRQYVSNMLLPYMDKETAAATRNWLFRVNPETFRRYEAQQYSTPAPIQAGEYDPAALKANLLNVAGTLDWDKFYQTPVGQALVKQGGQQEVSSPMAWMKQYLTTAAQGIGGTRAEQRAAAGRLATLKQEIEGQTQVDPNIAQFLTVAENIVNPLLKQQSGSSLIGQQRAIKKWGQDEFRRGSTYRNPFAL